MYKNSFTFTKTGRFHSYFHFISVLAFCLLVFLLINENERAHEVLVLILLETNKGSDETSLFAYRKWKYDGRIPCPKMGNLACTFKPLPAIIF